MFIVIKSEHYDCTNLICKKDTLEEAVAAVKDSMPRPNKINPKKPCPFCGAFLENEAPSTIWCHPHNSCLLSLRGIVGADQIAQWDTRYGEMTGKDNAICEE